MKRQISVMKSHFRSGTLEKTVQYAVSFLRVFFYLNFFMAIVIAAKNPEMIHEPSRFYGPEEVQVYVLTIIVLAALLNSLIHQWENWSDPDEDD
ncbi:MAG: hypothetical protein JXQ81_02280 [Desulfuromonadales bacterium]|nr:hypothetical protein [Desulfuromonadales bacterium]MBN2791313.1 hypothetical protein [Desulfuromonadales bacterium]